MVRIDERSFPSRPAAVKCCFGLGSLLVALVLGACVYQSDYDALAEKNKVLEGQVAQQSAQISAQQQQINRLQGAIKYTVESDLLFPSGGWQMSESGKQIIARLAERLAPTQQNKLYVNGYTDNAPIGSRLKQEGIATNEELSQRRAETVKDYLISQGVKPDMVEARGFGASNPVASNDTLQGRAQNRRVELTLSPA